MTMTDENVTASAVDLKTAGVEGWLYVLRQAAERRAELDALEQQAQQHIKDALGDNVEGAIDGRPVVRWSRTAAPRQFNGARFRKDHPELAKKYTTYGQPGRRFTLLETKVAEQ